MLVMLDCVTVSVRVSVKVGDNSNDAVWVSLKVTLSLDVTLILHVSCVLVRFNVGVKDTVVVTLMDMVILSDRVTSWVGLTVGDRECSAVGDWVVVVDRVA